MSEEVGEGMGVGFWGGRGVVTLFLVASGNKTGCGVMVEIAVLGTGKGNAGSLA